MSHLVPVVGLQLDLAWEDPESNRARARTMLAGLRGIKGGIVILPEMFPTGFTMNAALATEPDPAPTLTYFSSLALEWGVCVVGGFAGRGGQGPSGVPRNEAVAVDPRGRVLARYSKLHPFSPIGEHERYFAGDRIEIFEWQGLKWAVFICYDLRFPEIFRRAALEGVEAFIVIANWPAKRVEHWLALLRARAIENQAWVIGVNRTGRDPEFTYPGRSVVIDPQGIVVADAGDDERPVCAEVSTEKVRAWRRDFPALRDARRAFFGLPG